MPTPFACHWCDKPTMNTSGICDPCEQAYEEGNKSISELVRQSETRIRWLENGLKDLVKGKFEKNWPSSDWTKQYCQSLLDGEPTTADEHNCMIQYDDPGDENVVRISDVNKEIAKEWKNKKDV